MSMMVGMGPPLKSPWGAKKGEKMDLETAIKNQKCRKGPVAGTTKKGAYWLACEPIVLYRAGGDGIGQSGADLTCFLELRHFRGGDVRPTINYNSWHQNWGEQNQYYGAIHLNQCATIEEIIVALKSEIGLEKYKCYSEYTQEYRAGKSDPTLPALKSLLETIGLPFSMPAPDEIPA